MNNPTIILAFFNSIILIFNAYIAYSQMKSNQHIQVLTPIAKKILETIFIPYNVTIGRKLFKEITYNNYQEFSNLLLNFEKAIFKEDLNFYLAELLIFHLEKAIPYAKKTNLTKKELKKYNATFQNFSYFYYKEQNRFRKQFYLPSFGLNYRVNFKLYKNGFTFYIDMVMKLFYWVFPITVVLVLLLEYIFKLIQAK